jgi:hypothetical protein
VAAGFGVHGPLRDDLVVAFGETADTGEVPGEPRHAEGDRGGLGDPRGVGALVVEADGLTTGVREPVQGDVVQDEVVVQAPLPHRVVGHELRVPAEQADRGIGQRVRDRLWLLGVQLVERDLVVHEPLQLGQRGQVRLVQVLEVIGIAGGEREHLGHVDPDHVLGVEPSDLRGDHRARVVARRAVLPVTQAAHELGPGRGGALDTPAGCYQWSGEREPGQ